MRTGCRLLSVSMLAAVLAGCGSLETRVNPVSIAGNASSIVTAKFTGSAEKLEGQRVAFLVIDGEECGRLEAQEAAMDAVGRATVTYRGATGVEDCAAVIQATLNGEASITGVTVSPVRAPSVRIDGISAIAVVLIASFAIDRIVRGLLFLLSFWRRWNAVFHDPDDPASTHAGRKNYRLMYFVLAGALGLVALGWYGKVRILTALGFQGVDPILDTVITGLLLVGGAERTGAVLKGLGAGGDLSPATSSAPPQPIEITGTLVLDDSARKMEARVSSRDVAGV